MKIHRTLEYCTSIRNYINCKRAVIDGNNDDHTVWNTKNTKKSDRTTYVKFDFNVLLRKESSVFWNFIQLSR